MKGNKSPEQLNGGDREDLERNRLENHHPVVCYVSFVLLIQNVVMARLDIDKPLIDLDNPKDYNDYIAN